MAVIAVSSTDAGRHGTRWAVPPDVRLNDSPIPRGLRVYGKTIAVAALGAGDETNVVITFTFPTAFIYLPKSVTINFTSDDLTSEFANLGTLDYRPAGVVTAGIKKVYELLSNGQSFEGAAQSTQVYHPQGTWRQWVNGPDGDTMQLRLADVSGDASTAGDIDWTADFWEYDLEQCLRWPINTPQPTLTY